MCKMTARTEQVLGYHMKMKHSDIYLQMRQTASVSLQQKRERSGNTSDNHVKEPIATSQHKDNNENMQEKIKEEVNGEENTFKYEYCEKCFLNEKWKKYTYR